jgi:DNA-binding CsgD family transcriptional regulator
VAEAEVAIWRADVEAVRRAGVAGIALARADGPPDPSLAWLAILVTRAEADALEREAGAPQTERDRAAAVARLEAVEAAVRGVVAERPELGTGARTGAIGALLEAERARLRGRPDVTAWEAAANAWEALERPYTTAYARFRHAQAMVAARGSREAAAVVIRMARAACQALDARPLLGLVDELARAARLSIEDAAAGGGGAVAPTGPTADDPYGFTPREREVLELVADGRTNQQIAERLFITRKTASVHVSNVMAKLGAANRGEAAAIAHRLGLLE